MKKNNTYGMRSRSNATKYNNMINKLASQVSQKDLREDISEWIETSSCVDFTSTCIIFTYVQRPGAREPQVLPQEYKSMKSARMDCTRFLSEILADCGARCITTDIRNDRFYVTTENNVKITMVLE